MSAYGTWPTYGQNSQRTDANLLERTIAPSNASQLQRVWVWKAKAPIFSSLAAINGTAYVGTLDGRVHALNMSNGEHLWNTTSLGLNYSWTGCRNYGASGSYRGIINNPAIWNNTLYIQGSNTSFYGIDLTVHKIVLRTDVANNTNDKWTHHFNWASPLIYNGYAYIGTASGCDNPLVQGQLLMINLTTHAIVHVFNVTTASIVHGKEFNGGGIWSTPSVDRTTNTIWLTSGNEADASQTLPRSIIALNATTLSLVGHWQNGTAGLDQDFGDGATVFRNASGTPLVLATNKNGYTSALVANLSSIRDSPKAVWNRSIGGNNGNIAPAAFGNGQAFVGGYSTTIGTTHCAGSVRAANVANWTKTASRWDWTWQTCLNGPIQAGLTYANGLVYAASVGSNYNNSTLWVLNATNGRALKSFWLNQTINGEPVVVDGRIFVATGNLSSFAGAGYVDAFGLPYTIQLTKPLLFINFCQLNLAIPVQYGVTSYGGMPSYSYAWTFGDGGTDATANPLHFYQLPGNYTTNVSTEDSAAHWANASENVVAAWLNPPATTINGCALGLAILPRCPQIPCTGPLTRNFYSQIHYGTTPYSYSWSFGDGSARSDLQNPVHTYTVHGHYTVVLTVTDHAQNTATWTLHVWA